VSNEPPCKSANPNQNEKIDNTDSSNGGLIYTENKDANTLTTGEVCKLLSLPNHDLDINDVEIMKKKPKMPNYDLSSSKSMTT
jgi:hypothetical protein